MSRPFANLLGLPNDRDEFERAWPIAKSVVNLNPITLAEFKPETISNYLLGPIKVIVGIKKRRLVI